jgi:hypothetical protein
MNQRGKRVYTTVRILQHRKIRRAVGLYLDGEADPALAVDIRRHLGECWSCSQDAEWLLLLKAALRQIDARRPVDLAVARLGRYTSSLMYPPGSDVLPPPRNDRSRP